MKLEELVEESAEALLRYYSTFYYTGIENPVYLEAHEHNLIEAYKEHSLEPLLFHTHLVAFLCRQIIIRDDTDE